MRGGDILIECLKAQGVRCIFGMPGVQNSQIYDSLFRCAKGVIDHYLVRHEYAATKMADGYARVTGEVGVALTVPGPGASNAATGILEAFTDCVPVLLITGQSDSKFYLKDPAKMFHGLDQMRFFDPITKYCAIFKSVEEIPVIINEAFLALRTGRPGPVVLEMPMDIATAEADLTIPSRVQRPAPIAPDVNDVRCASEILKQSKMPILIAGSAVVHSNACEDLVKLAEKLNAPVAVTRRAKGAISDSHPLALRHTTGFMAREAIQHADCTLAIGVRFTDIDTSSWSLEFPQPLVQIDEDSLEIGREYSCEAGVVGGLKLTLRTFLETLETRHESWKPTLNQIRGQFNAQPPLPLLPDIREVLADDGIIAVDVHALGYASFNEFPIDQPQNFLYPCVAVSLGYAYPAAIGAKIAHPTKPVVCFSGDGGFMMGASELATAVRYGINVVAVVVNDSSLSSIKGTQQKFHEGRIIGTDLSNPDFSQFAKTFGAQGLRVKDLTKFAAILKDALKADRPTIIEVMMKDRQNELIDYISWLRSDPLRKF
ncbi:MAG: thiamine pyrophosphate-binding protein, partial [Desulfobacterales bacterium]